MIYQGQMARFTYYQFRRIRGISILFVNVMCQKRGIMG